MKLNWYNASQIITDLCEQKNNQGINGMRASSIACHYKREWNNQHIIFNVLALICKLPVWELMCFMSTSKCKIEVFLEVSIILSDSDEIIDCSSISLAELQ